MILNALIVGSNIMVGIHFLIKGNLEKNFCLVSWGVIFGMVGFAHLVFNLG